ncbi:MAG: hypothetical protein AMJ43_02690 [Coxiella sp. DG_40]|nr:MAG: hypothetical protein AMJ43_02690 [Coxiella sp. DG_40]
MFEQTTSNENAKCYTIQNPEQTITTFVDSRRKIDYVVNDSTKLSGYIERGIEEWAKRMQVTLGTIPFISQTEEIIQEAYVTYFREKMADFFREKKPFENLPSEEEAIEAFRTKNQVKKVPPPGEAKKGNLLERVKKDFLELDEIRKEKLANFLLIALNIKDPGLLHASSAFLSNGFLIMGVDDYEIQDCKDLIIKMTSDQNIYFESKGIISLKGGNVGEFVYNGFVNFVENEETKKEEIRIQDYLKLTSYDKSLTSNLSHIIRLFKLPRKNIYEILDDLVSQPKECDINEISILIRELIYRTFQELLKKSRDCKDNENQCISNLLTWLNEGDKSNTQDRKNEYWWRIKRRLQVFLNTQHAILFERFEISEANVLLGKQILNILQQAIIRKIMVNIFNDYRFIFSGLVNAIKTETKLEIPQDLVNKAEEFLSENQTLDSSLTDPKSVIECYENKITELFNYFKKQLKLNSNRNNSRIWFFKFFNPLSPLEKYIDEMHKQTINFMKIFAERGNYHLFTTPEQNNSSQVNNETLSKLIKML